MLRQSKGRLKASVPIAYVKDYWGIPLDGKVKQTEVDMFISHIFEVGLEHYNYKGGKNVQSKGL